MTYVHYTHKIPADVSSDKISSRPTTDESAYITAMKFVNTLKTTNVNGSTCVKYQTDGSRYMYGSM